MELKELAAEYLESSRKCSDRAYELRRQLGAYPESSGERMLLRRRINMLETMAKETWATYKYLSNYYRRPADEKKRENDAVGKRDREAELEELCKAIREASKRRRLPNGRSA